MKISILTLFPEMFSGPFQSSIIHRAIKKNIVSIDYCNIRNFATDRYKSVDDHPYGGRQGMILRVDIIDKALSYVTRPSAGDAAHRSQKKTLTVLLDPKGKKLTQTKVRELSKIDHLILLCGHYEGVDARVNTLVDEQISIGDYVLTGGELAAMVITDAVVRLLPGVLSKKESAFDESFTDHHTLEYPQYTRPANYKGMTVPAILLSGDHKKIEEWKKFNQKKSP